MLVMRTTKRPAHPVGEFIRAQQAVELHDLALAMRTHFGSMEFRAKDSASGAGN
jgi:hypothetical protein